MSRTTTLLFCMLWMACAAQNEKLTLNNPIGDSTIQRYISKYHQPLVLDFFASDCSVCFKMMPKIKKLQQDFQGRLQFVLVGLKDDRIKDLYDQFERKWNLRFPVIYDSILNKRAGMKFYPFYVWIDANGIIRAITGLEEVTRENLERFYQTNSVVISAKRPSYSFDPAKPLFLSDNGGPDSSLSYQFVFGNFYQGQPFYLPPSIDYFKNSSKFEALGTTIDDLYNYVYHIKRSWTVESALYGRVAANVVIESADSTFKKAAEGARYCISIAFKDTANIYDRLRATLKTQLDNYFGWESHLEVRKMPCWYLEAAPAAKTILRSKGGTVQKQTSHGGVRLVNQPITVLIESMFAENQLQPPILDRTGIDFNIDINLDAIMFDISDIHKALMKYGLNLVKGERDMQVIVLRPVNKNVAVSSFTATF
jgi:thiol-disulfide isomerase/thioredoxin